MILISVRNKIGCQLVNKVECIDKCYFVENQMKEGERYCRKFALLKVQK